MSVNLSSLGGAGWQFLNDSGAPLSGGLLFTYLAGTTTPATTYTSSNGLTANSNPIVLDAAGRPPAQIWLTDGILYKFVVKNSLNVEIRTYDNIPGISPDLSLATLSAPNGSSLIGYIQGSVGAVPQTVQTRLRNDFVVPQDFGAIGNGSANDTAAIQAALNAGSIRVPAGTYLVTATLNVPANRRIIADAGARILYAGSGAGLQLNGSNISIEGLTLDGNRTGNTYLSGSNAIDSRAPSWAARYTDIRITQCTITNWDDNGIRLDFTDGVDIIDNTINRVGRAGVLMLSPRAARVNNNSISNVAPGFGGVAPLLNAYGITFTRTATDDLTLNPLPRNCEAIGNIVDGVPSWEGIDTHGGQNIRFVGNTVAGCLIGIAVVPSDGPTVLAGASECLIAFNNVNGANAGGPARGSGISLSPASAGAGTVIGHKILGNILRSCGTDNPGLLPSAAIYVSQVTGAQVSDNYLFDSRWSAIDLANIVVGAVVTGNQIVNVINVSGNATGVRATSNTILATVDCNVLSGPYTGLEVLAVPSTNYGLYLGQNVFDNLTAPYTATTAQRFVGGTRLSEARGWINFDGTTMAVRAAYGVTVARTSAGIYTLTATDPALVGALTPTITASTFSTNIDTVSPNTVVFRTLNSAGTPVDAAIICVSLFAR